jgi:hypothetical protein
MDKRHRPLRAINLIELSVMDRLQIPYDLGPQW